MSLFIAILTNARICKSASLLSPPESIVTEKDGACSYGVTTDGEYFKAARLHRDFSIAAMIEKIMNNISLRVATSDDTAFALQVTEACMRDYAEQTWGNWDGRANLRPGFDEVIQSSGRCIGLIGVERRSDCWFLDKLYILPAYQNGGIGGYLLQRLIDKAAAAQVALRLTVLEVNPARRFYERHGFVLTRTIPPRHHLEWRGNRVA